MQVTVNKYDLLVIGAGSGGIATANRAAMLGANCAVIEASVLGGTCVNVGCVPKKVMWNAAHLAEGFALAQDYGFDVAGWQLDWSKLVANREAYIQRLHGIYKKNLQKNGVTLIPGHARFLNKRTLQVGDDKYQADHIVIACGGRPAVPAITGAEHGITSDGFFALQQQPGKVAVVGAGYIAVELAGVLKVLGTDTHLLLRRDKPLRSFDAMLSEYLLEAMRAQGIHVQIECVPQAVSKDQAGYNITTEKGETLTGFDQVIWAIGRLPNSDQLDLDKAGVAVDEVGYIPVDAYQNTVVDGVYALGDVTGKVELTPVAIAAGRRLARRLFGGELDLQLDYSNIPTVIFSHPPIGTVGLSEAEAQQKYGEEHVQVYQTRFKPMQYALAPHGEFCAMKIVTIGADEQVVGCHIIGDGADEMLQGVAVAIKLGVTRTNLHDTVAIHPTASEELVLV